MLFKFVIILLVTVHGLVDAKSVTSDGVPKKTLKEITDDGNQVMDNPHDCAAIYLNQKDELSIPASGVYTITPKEGEPFEVYCDMDNNGGGWTVIQRRGDYPNQENFYRDWNDYKAGFGSRHRDYWLGNDRISILTNQDVYDLRFDLEDFDGQTRFAEYSGFRVAGESDKYRMTFDTFKLGNIDDSFTFHKGSRFTTRDQDNDRKAKSNCAQLSNGAWWYKGGTASVVCYKSNLNGRYLRGDHPEIALKGKGLHWYGFHGPRYSLKMSRMKIRPADFRTERP